MIFQEPMTSFSPLHTIGNQMMETILLHRTRDKAEAREIAVDMLDRVGIPGAGDTLKNYPHHLSGGMRQRAMIAMALASQPRLLIADEPTTALDVTVQAQVLRLMRELQDDARHGDPLHLARPRRHRADGRRGGGDVSWARSSNTRGVARPLPRPRSTPTPRR